MLFSNIRRIFNKALGQPAYAIRVGIRRLIANAHYIFGGGRSSPPESVTLFLTHRCNLRCSMCGQWGEGGVTKKRSLEFIKEELSFDVLRSAVDGMSSYSPAVTLFGGEPLLYKDCIALIRHIKSKRMHCLIITNGFLIEEYARRLIDSGLDELNVSLDGSRDLHDRIRGVPGLFEKILSGLETVRDLKRSAGKRNPLVNIQCTITKSNYHRLEEMTAVASRAEANSLTFHNLIFTNKEILEKQKKFDDILGASSDDWRGFEFDPGIDPQVLREKMDRILSGRYDFSVDFYPYLSRTSLENYYNDTDYAPSKHNTRCLSPWIAAYVFPNGEVRPCLNSTYSYGNIKDAPLCRIWNSQKALRHRQLLRENKIFPACARCTELYRY
ncbi:MAG: radical SAM protein [Candidatus Omnitrophica bacterium]|nr:radical SAM protein [Candidatus Omnitrophota bacterium]MBU1037434.1 radical SAM protein [Candidatus Omnitrophota bacterium]MBU1807931.1 radical SAM protein [Candidatus Omnitrophota bacterium]